LLRASDKSLGNQLPFEIIEKCSSSYKDSTKEKKVFFCKRKRKKAKNIKLLDKNYSYAIKVDVQKNENKFLIIIIVIFFISLLFLSQLPVINVPESS
jgi:hypothetical protein